MIQINPKERLKAEGYLAMYKGTVHIKGFRQNFFLGGKFFIC